MYLYNRLEEITEIIRVLNGDVVLLHPLLGKRSIQVDVSKAEKANRRFYVRAVFALVEALVEQHKQLLLDLAEKRFLTLRPGIREVLSETAHFAKDNGTVQEREQYLQLKRKLRAVYRTAGDAFGQPLKVTFGDKGWQSFQAALGVRDRITHPKTVEACDVDEDALDTVDRGHEWFQELNSEFVRLAGEHRQRHGW